MLRNFLGVNKFTPEFFFKSFSGFCQRNKNNLVKTSLFLGCSYFLMKMKEYNSEALCWYYNLVSNDINNRVFTLQYSANDPIEDRFIFGNLEAVPGFVSGVFDGHGGWQVSEFISKNFINVLNSNLEKVKNDLSEKNVKNALYDTFNQLETDFITLIKTPYNLGFGKLASVGSCGLVALVIDQKLYIANLGDSKGILFSKLKRKKLRRNRFCRFK
jgi:hypothetical protein